MLTMQLKRDTLLERGKYRILATLGQGGFGITYLAEQALAGRKVCIKEYFPKDYYNRDADTNRVYIGSKADVDTLNRYKEKFIKEASVLARLKHPHIVSVYDVFEENDTAYYVMEHIEGESLGDVVKRRGALDEATAVGYIRQIADALGYIHEQNINHLDVKPSNVMVSSEDDSAILIDFGLAKHYDTSGGQTSSTPVGISHGYAPFEQYKAGGVSSFSPATDIYSLGATLYYLVTGKVPPHATDVGEEGLPKLPDHLSQGVHKAIERSMQYWRKDRPQSIEAFLALLDDSSVVTPVVDSSDADYVTVIDVENTVVPTPQPKPKKSKRGLWIMLSAFVVAAVASFILLGGGSSEKEDAPKSAVAMVDTLASSSDSHNLAKPEVDTLQLNDTPKEEHKEEAKPSETKPVTKPESPTKEDAKPEATKPVTQPNNEIWYTSSDGKIVNPKKDIFGAEIESNTYKNGKGILKFKGDVTTIGDNAFKFCSNLTSVTIPNSVKTIGKNAFQYCSNLTSVTIPNSVTTIGESAFNNCKSLTSVNIPNSVTTIGEYAFCECSNLTSITIPNNVTTIGDGAFMCCDNLKEFKGRFAFSDGRCLIIDGKLVAFAPAGIAEYTIPNSVTTIGKSAFLRCESLYSVTIPNSVTTIGEYAFSGCESLKSVTIPNRATTIGDNAFKYCSNLTSVTIPNSVTTIGEQAFYGCDNLTSVTIPNNVTEIGEWAFGYCSSLKEFKGRFVSDDDRCLIIDGKLVAFAPAGITEYTIPYSVKTIGEYAFSGCDSLTSVTIPNSVKTIGENAFAYCNNLLEETKNKIRKINRNAL